MWKTWRKKTSRVICSELPLVLPLVHKNKYELIQVTYTKINVHTVPMTIIVHEEYKIKKFQATVLYKRRLAHQVW